VSFGRSSIASHAQDRLGNRIGFLIDAARDCLEFLVATDSSSAQPVIGAWSTSAVPILQRLAIHGVAVDERRHGSDKLAWLLDHGWIFDHLLKHEVFELLALALPSAEEAFVDRLVAEASSGPGDVADAESRAYEAFNALVWINRYTQATNASEALDRAKADHPGFGIRAHPDFNSWVEAGFREVTAPMPIEEFHELLQGDRTAALDKLRELKEAPFSRDNPTWDDVAPLVKQVVQDHPEDGFVLLGTEADLDHDLVSAVIEGWGSGELPDELAERVIDRLSALDLSQWGDELARLIGSFAGTQSRVAWHRFDSARRLARSIASRLADGPVQIDGSDWLEQAIGAPGGLLAEFWVHVVSDEWGTNQASWTGLSDESRGAIDELIGRGGIQSALAEVVLASQLHFFFAADREWSQTNVLPLLAWDNPERARRTWDGFLFWGRWTDQLLEAGLLADYLQTAAHMEGFGDEPRRQFADHLTAVALYSQIDPGTWTGPLTAALPAQERVEWLDHIAWELDRLEPYVLQAQWSRWMRGYWRRRLDSIPLPLTFEEASALAGWVVKLEEGAIDEAVALAIAAEAGLPQHGHVLHDLDDRVDRAPAAYARLLAHLLTGTSQPFWECHYLQGIVARLHGHAEEADILRIREQGLRLGCAGAADW
jgi:hypothetical protein